MQWSKAHGGHFYGETEEHIEKKPKSRAMVKKTSAERSSIKKRAQLKELIQNVNLLVIYLI